MVTEQQKRNKLIEELQDDLSNLLEYLPLPVYWEDFTRTIHLAHYAATVGGGVTPHMVEQIVSEARKSIAESGVDKSVDSDIYAETVEALDHYLESLTSFIVYPEVEQALLARAQREQIERSLTDGQDQKSVLGPATNQLADTTAQPDRRSR